MDGGRLKGVGGRAMERLQTLPTLAWLGFFFALPTVLVFLMAFRAADPYGGLGAEWSLGAVAALWRPSYGLVLWRTVWMSLVATVGCLVLGLPAAYWIARLSAEARRWALTLIVVPFWTNFLIRIFAWKTVLHSDGALKHALAWLGLVQPETQLLFNPAAVIVVLVYNYLPFAILPIYAAAERFDFGLLDAARDLGAGSWKAHVSVFLPGISRGMATAFLVTFIPILGAYAIPDIVGGTGGTMAGNKIAERVFTDRNLPQASALAAALTLLVLAPAIAVLWAPKRRGQEARASGGVA